MNNISPNMIMGMLKKGMNPQQLVMQMLQNGFQNNPMMSNLFSLAQQGKSEQIETIARNMCATKGIDFDKEFNAFKSMLGGGK